MLTTEYKINFVAAAQGAVQAQSPLGGAGLRVMSGTVTSPSLAGQLQQLFDIYPEARWVQDDPVSSTRSVKPRAVVTGGSGGWKRSRTTADRKWGQPYLTREFFHLLGERLAEPFAQPTKPANAPETKTKPSMGTANIINAARQRLRDLNAEIKRLRALERERDELQRLLKAAKQKPATNVRSLRSA